MSTSTVKYTGRDNFLKDLRAEVKDYCSQQGIRLTSSFEVFADWRMYMKSVIALSAYISLFWLVFINGLSAWWAITLGAIGFGAAKVFLGLNIMHDATHGSFSRHRWINYLFGLTLEGLGGNTTMWEQKHNREHHGNTNTVHDDDIKIFGMIVSPEQKHKWKPVHAKQHWYAIFFYGLVSFLWSFYTDYARYFSKTMRKNWRELTIREHVQFWVSKLFYYTYILFIPIYLHGFEYVIPIFLVAEFITGFSIAIIFQMAHLQPDSAFPEVGEDHVVESPSWAVLQVLTTANFATKDRWFEKVLTYLFGGLTHQIEHHLFPKISHWHYPKISVPVRKVCERYNIPYVSYETFSDAIKAHWRFLKIMGQKPQTA